MSDKFEFEQGYTGAHKNFSGAGDAGQAVSALGKKQTGSGEALASQNKGAFATQAHNGSTSTANSFNAAGTMHAANAAGGASFVRRSAEHEDTGAHTQSGDSNAVESHATELTSKINFTA